MNVYRAGMEDLTPAERRQVRRAISRGQRLEDPRLAAALLRHVDAYLSAPARYEAVNAVVVAVVAGLTMTVLWLLWDGFIADVGSLLFFAAVMGAAQLLLGRPLRRSLYEKARRRHRGVRSSRP